MTKTEYVGKDTFNELYFELTYNCTAQCNHCYLSCSPHFKSATIPVSKWIEVLRIAKASSIIKPNLVVAGGEPTILFQDLLQILSCAKELNFNTAIITNAWWADTLERADAFAKELIDSGLSRVEISCSKYHQEYIGSNCISNAIQVFKRYSIPVKILFRYDNLDQRFCLLRNIEGIEYCEISEAPVLPIRKTVEDHMYHVNAAQLRGRCIHDLSLTVTPFGDVFPCCCGSELHKALCLGNIFESSFSSIIENYRNCRALQFIATFGPSAAIQFLTDYNDLSKKEYSHICLQCIDVFKNQNNISQLDLELKTKSICEENYKQRISECFASGLKQPSGANLLFLENYVIKSAKGESAKKLKHQAKLLKRFEENGIDVVPRVLDMEDFEGGFYYVMPRYTEIKQEITKELISKVFKLLKRIWFYKKQDSVIEIDGYISRTYGILKAYDESFAKRYKEIGLELAAQFKCISPCFVHGDPTLENLAYNAEKGEFILLDPNPQFSPEVSIPHLDVAKIMQSVCGWESFVNKQCCEVTFTEDTMSELIFHELGENQWPLVAWLMISHLIRTLPYGAKINNSRALIPSIQKNILTLERMMNDGHSLL